MWAAKEANERTRSIVRCRCGVLKVVGFPGTCHINFTMMGGITVFIHPTENGPDEYKNESATKVKMSLVV